MNFYGIIAIIISFAVSLSLLVCKPEMTSVITPEVIAEEKCNIDFENPPKPEITKIKRNFESDTLFKFNRYRLTNEGKKQIDELILEIEPGTTINIIGHSDKIGRKIYNQRLSEKRAAAVATYIKTKINNEIQFAGVGESISSGKTDNCAKNNKKCFKPDRRIEIEFYSTK